MNAVPPSPQHRRLAWFVLALLVLWIGYALLALSRYDAGKPVGLAAVALGLGAGFNSYRKGRSPGVPDWLVWTLGALLLAFLLWSSTMRELKHQRKAVLPQVHTAQPLP